MQQKQFRTCCYAISRKFMKTRTVRKTRQVIAAAVILLSITISVTQVSSVSAQVARRASSPPQQRSQAVYTNPVIAGDYPDPSVIRVGQDYYATATSSEWAPEFPLLHSRDLVNWRVIGAVFQSRPAWSVGNYWAPEISADRGRYFVYYTARKKPERQKEGPLCVAVASAARPQGPYTDRGPLICQDAGSIDAFPVRDENNKNHLVWKYDGNSQQKPTPIYAQPLSEDGTRLVGEMRELISNTEPWEAQLVEGPFITRRAGYFYMFYSGNACCGRECNYALGVARAKQLLGPWEKYSGNPILKGNDEWKCPGHGSIVSDPSGRDYLMYHAYHPKDFTYVGRQALLDDVEWTADGWAKINAGQGPSGRAAAPLGISERNREHVFYEEFLTPVLRPGWQWIQSNKPGIRINTGSGGRLVLSPAPTHAGDVIGGVVGWWTTVGDYVATTRVNMTSLQPNVYAGLGAYGDTENALGIVTNGDKVMLYRREKKDHRSVAEIPLPAGRGPALHLRMTARGGNRFRFAVSRNGVSYQDIGEEVDGSYLPPWDRGIRVALTAGGSSDARATFEAVRVTSQITKDNRSLVGNKEE